MSLPERLRRHACRLLPPGCPVLVAVSGGGDSVALLHLLHRAGYQVQAAHLDHALRPDSDKDRAFVEELCQQLGVACHSRRVQVARLARLLHLSVEAAGRLARYRFLGRLAARLGIERIATGHTADDQAETLLWRLIRGAGRAGLVGIRPRLGRLVRPLLPFTRTELRGYLTEQGLAWREDPTNLDPAQPRAWVRHRLLPLLAERNPEVVGALCRLAEAARQDEQLLGRLAARRLDRLAARSSLGLKLPVEALRRTPAALRARLWVRACQRAAGRRLRLGSRHLAALEDLLAGPQGRWTSLPQGLTAHRLPGWLELGRPAEPEAGPEPVPLAGPGTYDLPAWGLRLTLQERPGPLSEPVGGATEAAFDLSRLPPPWQVRARRPGDRFRPFRGAGTVKLKKYLHGKGLSRRQRDLVPLLTAQDQVAWVVGFAPDARVLAGPTSSRILWARVEPLGE